jgi:hypothetical protein
MEKKRAVPLLKELNISYNKFFSVVDYHRKKKTKMWQNKDKTWQMSDLEWNRSKGDYLFRKKIDIHFDDSYTYANWCPDNCTYVVVPKENFGKKFIKLFFEGDMFWQ